MDVASEAICDPFYAIGEHRVLVDGDDDHVARDEGESGEVSVGERAVVLHDTEIESPRLGPVCDVRDDRSPTPCVQGELRERIPCGLTRYAKRERPVLEELHGTFDRNLAVHLCPHQGVVGVEQRPAVGQIEHAIYHFRRSRERRYGRRVRPGSPGDAYPAGKPPSRLFGVDRGRVEICGKPEGRDVLKVGGPIDDLYHVVLIETDVSEGFGETAVHLHPGSGQAGRHNDQPCKGQANSKTCRLGFLTR